MANASPLRPGGATWATGDMKILAPSIQLYIIDLIGLLIESIYTVSYIYYMTHIYIYHMNMCIYIYELYMNCVPFILIDL